MDTIESFWDDYRFLSNFYPVDIEYEGIIYPSAEHAYQAAKVNTYEEKKLISHLKSPGKAKKYGKELIPPHNWDYIKKDIMLQILRRKFNNNELNSLLLGTCNSMLIEGNNWGDTYWGCVKVENQWVGENHLGKLLMQVRDEFKAVHETKWRVKCFLKSLLNRNYIKKFLAKKRAINANTWKIYKGKKN